MPFVNGICTKKRDSLQKSIPHAPYPVPIICNKKMRLETKTETHFFFFSIFIKNAPISGNDLTSQLSFGLQSGNGSTSQLSFSIPPENHVNAHEDQPKNHPINLENQMTID
jgi:hypothetical protein